MIPADLVPVDCTWPIVLGVDPGTRYSGWGAIVVAPDRPRFVACGIVAPEQDGDIAVRIGTIGTELRELLARLRPSAVALEGAFAARNVRSALRIGEARGVVLAACGERSIP